MKTHFALDILLKEKKISVIQLAQKIADSGKAYNPNLLLKIKNQTIKRIPIDIIADISIILQVHPDTWIHVIDSPIVLQKEYTDHSISIESSSIALRVDLFLQQKDWKQKDLKHWLDQHDIPYRPMTIHEICHQQIRRLPVELIAPISVALGKTPGSWISVSFPAGLDPSLQLFNLQSLLTERSITLEQLITKLETIHILSTIEELTAIYENKTDVVRPELLLGISKILNVSLDHLFSKEHSKDSTILKK